MKRSRFFLIMSSIFFAIVLIGFARTLYLSTLFDSPELPVHLILHGIVLTIWFLLAIGQPLLIAKNQTQLHRRIGLAGLATVIAVVAVSLLTLAIRDASTMDLISQRSGGNLFTLFAFSFCALLGLKFKSKPSTHKRLMLIASMPILAPATDRMARIPAVNEFFGSILFWFPAPPEVAVALLGFLAMIISVVVHDLLTDKRVHAGTLWGLGVLIIAAPAASAAMMMTGAWIAIVRLLG